MAALDAVVGIKNITADGTTYVPTRGTLHVQGAGVALDDDPDAGETILTFVATDGAASTAITPPELDADVTAAYAPDGIGPAKVVRLSASEPVAVHGLVAPGPGDEPRKTFLVQQASSRITLKHGSVSAAAGARFAGAGAADYILLENASIDLLYDATASVWRVVA